MKNIERIETLAYRLYRKDWCKRRRFPYIIVKWCEKHDRTYKGIMYACMGEFLEYEFTDRDYMKYLLRHHKKDYEWLVKTDAWYNIN